MTMMSNEEEKRCPLCAEEMDWTDQQFKPCKCGYQVCVWCWHHIMDIAEKDVSEGRCPACRTKYEKDKVVAMQANFERAGNTNVNRKSKPPKAKTKANEVRKDLTNVRVIQRKMAYVTGLPLGIADEDLLQRKEYFGQYGKISKVSLSRTAGGSIQLFTNDTFSVYITYSKEEEAIQCIQSVHGFILEGMYLRASFGTAKYCHAWLRNTPCNNLSCLYLHSLGADEDSFGKDEVAAIHTRSRVQQIVGASSSAMKRSGNILPPPINELSCTSFTSTESSTIQSAVSGAASDIVNHNSYMARVIPCSDKDEDAGDPNRMSAFVDVGLCNSSGAEKVRNCSGDSRTLDLCSNLSPETINKDNLAQEPYSDTLLFEVPSSNHLVNHLPRDQNSIEISDEPFREDSISIDSQKLKDLNSINQSAFLMSSHSAKSTGDSGGHSLMHRRTCSLSNNGTEHRSLHNEVEEASPPLSCVNSTMIDGLHDLKFQSSVKSDTIYRGSNSFSNEEIVEHLRRTRNDCLNNYDESSAFSPAKNSMNSNILAMNLGSRDDSLTLRHSLTGLCNEPNGQHDSWKFLHSGQGFSFMKQDGSSGQRADLNSSSSNISLISKQASILHDFREKKEQHMLDSQYQISRPNSMAPPGFSISSRELPPAFPLSDEIGGFPRTLSGSQLVNSSSSLIHYPSSMRSFSSAGLEIGSQGRALEAEARLWLLMQRKHADQDGKLSHVHASQTPSAYQDQRFNGEDEHTGTNKFGPRLVDQGQNFDQSLYTHFPLQKFGNGSISNGFQHDLLEISNVEMSHSGAAEENGYHLGNKCDKQLLPDGQLPPSGVAVDLVSLGDPTVASGPSSAAVHQANAKSSVLECADEIVAASDGQTNERSFQCMLSDMDKVDVSTPGDFPDKPPLPNGISSTKVNYDVSALSSICLPVREDISPSNPRSPKAVSNNIAIPENLDAGESQDITCFETPKTADCLEQSIFDEDTGAQVHILSRCNASAQLDASKSSCEHAVNNELPSNFSGFHLPETSKEGALHASAGYSEQISKESLVKDTDKSTNRADNVVPEDHRMEFMSSSAASALPAPEKILSMSGGLVDLPRSIFPEATPDYLAGFNEVEAGDKFISGKKRSYTESTLTEQSLNSAESSRMVRSKKSGGFIPDDDDLLSSILVGRRSSALKLKATPRPSEITSSKRARSAVRMSASKRKVLMDDIMVLHGDMIRQQLIHAEDIRRIRKKAPCTHAEISAIQKQLLEDEIFRAAVLTGLSVELASLHKQTFDLSTVKVSSSSDVSCSHAEKAVEPQITAEYAENSISNLEEQRQQPSVECAEKPISNLEEQRQQLTAEYAENPITNLEEQQAMVCNESHVERESGKEGSDERFVARDDSILGAVEATIPTENKEVDEHYQCLNSDASQLRPDAVTDVAAANGFHLEPSDNTAEIGSQVTYLSGADAADTATAAKESLACPKSGGLGGDGDIAAGLPLTDPFNESGREADFILPEVSYGSPNRAPAAQADKSLENLNDENIVVSSDWPESNYFISEAETEIENMVEDAVPLEAAQDSATVEIATNVEDIVADDVNQSFADNIMGTEQPKTDASYDETNMHLLDDPIGAGDYPCKQEDFSYNMMGTDLTNGNLGDLNDLHYSAAGNDTGFLNFDDDDDEEAEAADDYVPAADVTRITENIGWSSRTRAVSKYLQTLFIKESERGRTSLSMDSLLVGKTRKEASRMFFETLVLKTRDYLHVEQVIPFDDITIKPGMKLMKSDF